MRTTLLAAVAASLTLATAPALAQAPPPEPPSPARWYGWQTLIVGGGSFALVAAAIPVSKQSAAASNALVASGVGGYLLGGPIVHWAHGHVGKGFASLGLNVAGPLLGGLLAGGLLEAAGSSNHAFSGFELGFLFVGMPLGAVAAVALDAAALAREPAPAAVGWRSLTPTLRLPRGAPAVGLAGAF